MSYLSESVIRRLIPEMLVCLGGVATKREIIGYIEDNCVLDPVEDLALSRSRKNEPIFYQRVGNIISHANKTGLSYVECPEGFALMRNPDANVRDTWLFILPNFNVSLTQVSLQSSSVNSYKKSTFVRKPIAKKYPWDEIEKKKKEVAVAGERFVYETEYALVKQYFPSEISRVEWVSQTQGDGLGFDVRSIDPANPHMNKLIEVKSTTSAKPDSPFYMTPNERRLFESKMQPDDILVLYRLYKPSVDYAVFKKKVITQSELLVAYGFEPSGFKVVKK